ncbi:MAG: thermonuclease family protein [archaeon]
MKRKTWYWIIGILAFLVIISVPSLFDSGLDIPNEEIKPSLKLGEPTYPTLTGDSSQTENEITPISTKVTYVVDGDTLDINTGERVRLICIDTPETYENYYQEAKDYLKILTLNKEIRLEKDVSETDRYGRILRYIYLTDGTFVNELIVKQGYGKAYPYSPDTSLCPQIEEAEQYAKNNNLGIWADVEETPFDDSDYICSYNAYNCDDFTTHAQAQAIFNACGGISNDIHWLDGDDDGLACENLP